MTPFRPQPDTAETSRPSVLRLKRVGIGTYQDRVMYMRPESQT